VNYPIRQSKKNLSRNWQAKRWWTGKNQ